MRAAIFISAVLLAGCQAESAPSGDAPTHRGSLSGLDTEQEAEAAALRALRGERNYAHSLYIYASEKRDEQAAHAWLNIALENGDSEALASMGTELARSADYCDRVRAVALLQRYVDEVGPTLAEAHGREFGDRLLRGWEQDLVAAKQSLKATQPRSCVASPRMVAAP